MVKNIIQILVLAMGTLALAAGIYSFGHEAGVEKGLEKRHELQEDIKLLEEKNYDLTDQVWSLTNYIEKEIE